MPKLYCSKLCNADWQASSSPEEELFCAKKMCAFCAEWAASFGSMPMKKFCGNVLHVTVPVLCSKPRTRERDLPSCCGNEYHSIRRSEEHTSELQSHSDLVCR